MIPSHRGSGVPFLHQDVASAVVDVLEAVRTQQDPSVPSGHDHHDVAHVQNLRGDKSERNVRPAWAGERTGERRWVNTIPSRCGTGVCMLAAR